MLSDQKCLTTYCNCNKIHAAKAKYTPLIVHATCERLLVTVVVHAVFSVAVCDNSRHRFTGRQTGIVRGQVVHGVGRVTGDLLTDLQETWQRKIISGERRERLQNHQTLTPAQARLHCSIDSIQ